MKDGTVFRRTKGAKMQVRPEALPELVAWLGVWVVRCRRGIRTTDQAECEAIPTWRDKSSEHYRSLEKALRWLIGQAAGSFSELEFDVLMVEAAESLAAQLNGPPQRGGLHPEVPSSVAALAHQGRIRLGSEGDHRADLRERPALDPGVPPGGDRGPAGERDAEPHAGGPGGHGDDRQRRRSKRPGGKKVGGDGAGGRPKRARGPA